MSSVSSCSFVPVHPLDFDKLDTASPRRSEAWASAPHDDFWIDYDQKHPRHRTLASSESVLFEHGYLNHKPNIASQLQIAANSAFCLNDFCGRVDGSSYSIDLRFRLASDANIQTSRLKVSKSHVQRYADRIVATLASMTSSFSSSSSLSGFPSSLTTASTGTTTTSVSNRQKRIEMGLSDKELSELLPGMEIIDSWDDSKVDLLYSSLIQMTRTERDDEQHLINNSGRKSVGTRFSQTALYWRTKLMRPVHEDTGAPLYWHDAVKLGKDYKAKGYANKMSFLVLEFPECPQRHFLIPIFSTFAKQVHVADIKIVVYSAFCNYCESTPPYNPLPWEQLAKIGAPPFEIAGGILQGRGAWVFVMQEIKSLFQHHVKRDKETNNWYAEFVNFRKNGRLDRLTVFCTTAGSTPKDTRRQFNVKVSADANSGRFSKPRINQVKAGGMNAPLVSHSTSGRALSEVKNTLLRNKISEKYAMQRHSIIKETKKQLIAPDKTQMSEEEIQSAIALMEQTEREEKVRLSNAQRSTQHLDEILSGLLPTSKPVNSRKPKMPKHNIRILPSEAMRIRFLSVEHNQSSVEKIMHHYTRDSDRVRMGLPLMLDAGGTKHTKGSKGSKGTKTGKRRKTTRSSGSEEDTDETVTSAFVQFHENATKELSNLLQKTKQKINSTNILLVDIYLSDWFQLPAVVLFRAFGIVSVEEISRYVILNDPPELSARYANYLNHCLRMDEGCETRRDAEMRIGRLWCRNKNETEILNQFQHCIRNQIIPYQYELVKMDRERENEEKERKSGVFAAPATSPVSGESKKKPNYPPDEIFHDQAMMLGFVCREIMHRYCGYRSETSETSFVHRTLATSQDIYNLNTSRAITACNNRLFTQLIDMDTGNNDPEPLLLDESPDVYFKRLVGIEPECSPHMQIDEKTQKTIVYVNRNSVHQWKGIDYHKLYHVHTFNSTFNQLVTPKAPLKKEKQRGLPGVGAPPSSGVKQIQRQLNTAMQTSLMRRCNHKADNIPESYRTPNWSHHGMIGQYESPHGKDAVLNKNIALNTEFSADPTPTEKTVFEKWLRSKLDPGHVIMKHDEAKSPSKQRVHRTWIVLFIGKVMGGVEEGYSLDQLEWTLLAIKCNPVSPMAFRHMSVIRRPEIKVLHVDVCGHRMIRPVFFLDKKTQRPHIPKSCLQTLANMRAWNDLQIGAEPWNRTFLLMCAEFYNLMNEAGAIMFMDTREMEYLRVCANPSQLGLLEEKAGPGQLKRITYDVCELSPEALCSFVAASNPGKEHMSSPRDIGGIISIKNQISWPDYHFPCTQKQTTRLCFPQFSLFHTPFCHDNVNACPGPRDLVVFKMVYTTDDIEDAIAFNKTAEDTMAFAFTVSRTYTFEALLNMRVAINSIRPARNMSNGSSSSHFTQQKSVESMLGGARSLKFIYHHPCPHQLNDQGLPMGGLEDSETYDGDYLSLSEHERRKQIADRHLGSDGIVRVGSFVSGYDTLVRFCLLYGPMLDFKDHEFGVDGQCNKTAFGELDRKGLIMREYVPKGKHGQVVDVERIIVNNKIRIFIHIAWLSTSGTGKKFSSRQYQKHIAGRAIPQIKVPWSSSGLRPEMFLNPHSELSRLLPTIQLEMQISKVAALKNTLLKTTKQYVGCQDPHQTSFVSNSAAAQPHAKIPLNLLETLSHALDPMTSPCASEYSREDAEFVCNIMFKAPRQWGYVDEFAASALRMLCLGEARSHAQLIKHHTDLPFQSTKELMTSIPDTFSNDDPDDLFQKEMNEYYYYESCWNRVRVMQQILVNAITHHAKLIVARLQTEDVSAMSTEKGKPALRGALLELIEKTSREVGIVWSRFPWQDKIEVAAEASLSIQDMVFDRLLGRITSQEDRIRRQLRRSVLSPNITPHQHLLNIISLHFCYKHAGTPILLIHKHADQLFNGNNIYLANPDLVESPVAAAAAAAATTTTTPFFDLDLMYQIQTETLLLMTEVVYSPLSGEAVPTRIETGLVNMIITANLPESQMKFRISGSKNAISHKPLKVAGYENSDSSARLSHMEKRAITDNQGAFTLYDLMSRCSDGVVVALCSVCRNVQRVLRENKVKRFASLDAKIANEGTIQCFNCSRYAYIQECMKNLIGSCVAPATEDTDAKQQALLNKRKQKMMDVFSSEEIVIPRQQHMRYIGMGTGLLVVSDAIHAKNNRFDIFTMSEKNGEL